MDKLPPASETRRNTEKVMAAKRRAELARFHTNVYSSITTASDDGKCNVSVYFLKRQLDSHSSSGITAVEVNATTEALKVKEYAADVKSFTHADWLNVSWC